MKPASKTTLIYRTNLLYKPFVTQKHTPVQKSVLCISIVVLSLLSEFLLALADRLFRFTAGYVLRRIQRVARLFVELL